MPPDNQFLNAKPSDFNKYAKLGKLAVYDVGYRWSMMGLVFLLLLVCSMFAFASNVNEVFTFNSLLSAIRDIPSIDIIEYRVSDDLKSLSDSIFDYAIGAVVKLMIDLPDLPGLDFLLEPLFDIVQFFTQTKTFVGKLVLTLTLPLDFFVYIIASCAQLTVFILYFVQKFFMVPVLPI